MQIEEKIEQWKQLKQSKKAIEARIKILRQEIYEHVAYSVNSYDVEIQQRDLTTFDSDKVRERMYSKGIHEDSFTRKVIDPDKLEQLYFEGMINDDDLRYVREPKYIYALVEKRGDTNVQTKDDNVGPGS